MLRHFSAAMWMRGLSSLPSQLAEAAGPSTSGSGFRGCVVGLLSRGFTCVDAAGDGSDWKLGGSRGHATMWPDHFVSLNNIADNPKAHKRRKRVGRGTGSGLGKTSGKGHKGQKARAGPRPKIGFEGGQTPINKRFPKRGFHNPNAVEWVPLNLKNLQEYIKTGRIDASKTITMKDIRDSGLIHKKVDNGVKLLGNGTEEFDIPIHIQVSKCSRSAREAVEKAGGTVTSVYYNKLGLRALLKPEAFVPKGRLLPSPVRAIPVKHKAAYDAIGQIPPDVQHQVSSTIKE